MASLPYPLCHDCQADIVGMARMPYPPTICNEILTITLPFILYYFFLVLVFFFEYVVFFFVVVVFFLDVVVTGL